MISEQKAAQELRRRMAEDRDTEELKLLRDVGNDKAELLMIERA